jgi:hypothetical protein
MHKCYTRPAYYAEAILLKCFFTTFYALGCFHIPLLFYEPLDCVIHKIYSNSYA